MVDEDDFTATLNDLRVGGGRLHHRDKLVNLRVDPANGGLRPIYDPDTCISGAESQLRRSLSHNCDDDNGSDDSGDGDCCAAHLLLHRSLPLCIDNYSGSNPRSY